MSEPFAQRLAGWLEGAANPVLVKELRGSLRGIRHAATRFGFMTLFGVALLVAYRASGTGSGILLFETALVVQAGALVLLIPSLAATSLSSGREGQTFDLLITTTLKPAPWCC